MRTSSRSRGVEVDPIELLDRGVVEVLMRLAEVGGVGFEVEPDGDLWRWLP